MSVQINPVNLDFALPEELIAQEPLKERDRARLMVLDRKKKSISNETFKDISSHLKKGDVLVINTAKVNSAKLIGKKSTGGRVEVILIAPTSSATHWRALVRPELKPGTEFTLGTARVRLTERTGIGENILSFEEGDAAELMKKEGILPLPPYIKREVGDARGKEDETYYQTVYASTPGSLAAPTAGLHFSKELLTSLKAQGVEIIEILLHVGWGTFRPVSKTLDEHKMLEEQFEVSPKAYKALLAAKKENRRIIAVGTTATRTLESLTQNENPEKLKRGTTLFIKPGFEFKWVSGLITNFHVPRSTPVSLTAAFSGIAFLEKAYGEAVSKKYKFFSYGDAMLIL